MSCQQSSMPSRLRVRVSSFSVLKTKFRDAISSSRESSPSPFPLAKQQQQQPVLFEDHEYRNEKIVDETNDENSDQNLKMPLTILTDQNVKDILQSLDREELMGLQDSMQVALHEYATGTTASGSAAINQPNRTVIESGNGTTTLFMPSTSSSGIGMKGTSPTPSFLTSGTDSPQSSHSQLHP